MNNNLIKPISRPEESNNNSFKFNFNALVSNDAQSTGPSITATTTDESTTGKKKRGRPPKTKVMEDGSTVITAKQDSNLTMMQSNTPYLETYDEPNMLLRGSISQIDDLSHTVKDQLDNVVESKTLRKKYDYISELSSTAANLISTKVRTISEMNKVITDSHNLDIKRLKDLKMSAAAEEADNDKRVMDAYLAYVNAPIGSYGAMAPQFPSMQDMTTASATLNNIDIATGGNSEGYDPGYSKWKQEMSPETNMMIMQKNNPNIKTVVVYDQSTNTKQFEVMDTSTGQYIPGAPKPAESLLADTYPNINNGTARNSNIDAVYPLVLTGAPSSLQDY